MTAAVAAGDLPAAGLSSRRLLAISIAVAAVLVAILLLERRAASGHNVAPRPFLGRLHDDIDYAPFVWTAQSAADLAKAERLSSSLRSSGATDDDAIESLRRSKTAGAHSDLAAVLLDRAARQHQPDDLLAAAGEARKALDLAPASAPARFNYALALEQVHLRSDARRAWNDYLDVDARSGWADEARAHLAALAEPTASLRWTAARNQLLRGSGDVTALVAQFPQQSRLLAEDELLPAGNLRLARAIGDALAPRDSMVRDAVAAFDGADAARAQQLATGHRQFGEARAELDAGNIGAALAKFQESSDQLRRAGSPFAARASLFIGSCLYSQNDLDGTLAHAEHLLAELGPRATRYPTLTGQLEWLRGLAEMTRANPSAAVERDGVALQNLTKAGEEENAAAVHSLLAEAFDFLGESDRSNEHRFAAIAAIDHLGLAKRIEPVFSEAAFVVANDDPRLALLFMNAVVQHARLRGFPTPLSDALFWRALIRGRAGDLRGADADLAEARTTAVRVEDAKERALVVSLIDSVDGFLSVDRDPARAIELTSRALAFDYAHQRHYHVAQLLLARGRARVAHHDLAAAEADFKEGVRLLESQRQTLREEEQRLSFFERADALFDELISLLIRRGRAEEALEYAERARARVLLDEVAHSPAVQPRTPEAIRASLPEGTTIVEYASLPDELVLWIVRRDGVRSVTAPVGSAELARRATQFMQALQDGRDDGGSALYDLLLRPAVPEIAGAGQLVIVPDKSLGQLAFAALFDRERGQYLIEKQPLTAAPSASLFVSGHAPRTAAGRALLVGNPHFDRSRFSALPNLPRAEEEVREIAAIYPRPELLTGDAATKRAFWSRFDSSSIVHFAGHAVDNPRHPAYSALLLARDGADDGVLFARDIGSHRRSNVRLVVLSACGTARGKTWNVEGEASLARAFLAAGVPSVVATLWPIDDASAAPLLRRLHEGLLRGEAPDAALREAQLAAIHGRAPLQWAAFQLAGVHSATVKGGVVHGSRARS